MAYPKNPLDEFISYTYHFELHAAKTWEELQFLENNDYNLNTNQFEPNGTLLINTRKDAHQTIEGVRFLYATGYESIAGPLTPGQHSSYSIQVTEPGGMFFAEKVKSVYTKANANNPGSLVFALKIFFVGQKEGQLNVTTALQQIIPMFMIEMTADFNQTGGRYNMAFASDLDLTPRHDSNNVIAFNAAYVNKAISVKAKTVKEGLKQLELKLNQNYEKTYKTILENKVGARPLRYEINILDSRIDGKLNMITKESMAPGDDVKLIFGLEDHIGIMINKILTHSKELNDMVASGRENVNVQFQPNVKCITVLPRLWLREKEAVIAYDIDLFEGGENEDLKYEFDFYFSEAGKNVDVMEFETKFPVLGSQWMTTTDDGVDKQSNMSGTVPEKDPNCFATNVCHPDVTKHRLENLPMSKIDITCKPGDVAWENLVPRTDIMGHVTHPVDAVQSHKMVTMTNNEMISQRGPQFTFTIRGHQKLLLNCIAYPDGTIGDVPLAGLKGSLWAKINIHGLNEKGERVQFYYKDYYQVWAIEHVFQNGQFIQLITASTVDTSDKQKGGQPGVAQPAAESKKYEAFEADYPGSGSIPSELSNPAFANTPAKIDTAGNISGGAATGIANRGRFTKEAVTKARGG